MPRRRSVGVIALAAIVVAATASLAVRATTGPSRAGGPAESAATYFLDHYETGSGQVVRRDQGGDTVSEGQAYAMLLAVAAGDQARFAAAWRWTRAHLVGRDGLMAWRWDSGRVTDTQSASDADVDAAWALTLAADRFDDPDYHTAAARLAGAVVGHEVVGRQATAVLVAGPWATGPTVDIDPSYDAPVDFSALAAAFPDGGAWSGVSATARRELGQLLAGGHLPSDWAVLGSDGMAHPTSTPNDPGADVRYGFDAVRVPVRLAASCTEVDRSLAAGMWGVLSGPVARHQPLVDLDLGGSPTQGASASPVGLVGAAAAAQAAGHPDTARQLLAQAQSANAGQPTYYGSAWVALGRVLLQTRLLGGCGVAGDGSGTTR